MCTIKNLLLFFFTATLLTGCGKLTYRKTPGGLPYLIYKGKGTEKISAGNIVKMNLSIKVKDSFYYNSFQKMAVYMKVSQESIPYDISEIWTKVGVGDSIIATQMMDTIIKNSPPNSLPPYFIKGGRIIIKVKVLDVFASDSAAEADKIQSEKEWSVTEVENIKKYLAAKNISAQKTPSGAFVQIINRGTGNLIDSGKYVSVNYTGTTFSGKKIDSNTDSAFRHFGPSSFTVNAGQMINGFDEAMRLMKPGCTARVYVPSMQAYGGKPDPQSGIPPYESLIYDITIVDVKDKAPDEMPAELLKKKRKLDATQSQK